MRRLICCLVLWLAAPVALAALDLNTASEAELDALPGVGPSRAQAIIEHRAKNGAFSSIDELRQVKGIGDKTFAELKPLLTIRAEAGVSTADTTASTPSAVPASGGFPWWIVVVIAVAAVIAVVMMRRRAPPSAVQAPAAAPVPEMPTPAAPPVRPVASPPSRPAGGTTSTQPASPGRPAGAPPRPAGGAASPTAPSSADSTAAAPPKPAGAPPKPAGSR